MSTSSGGHRNLGPRRGLARARVLASSVIGPAGWRVRAAARAVAKDSLSRFPLAMTCILIANNVLWLVRLRLGITRSFSFAMHHSLSTAESARYIEGVFSDYKHYGQIDRFWGDVAEVGPGDSAGVALLMRGDGCNTVDLIDQFASVSDPGQQLVIYHMLADSRPLSHLIQDVELSNVAAVPGVTWITGMPAERYFRQCLQNGKSYDMIVSRAVMEHLYDPLGAIANMIYCLRPGGVMIHKIDLRDHRLFSIHHHELTWLRFPRWLWRSMTRYSGHPNRVLVHRYRALLNDLANIGLIEYQLLVTEMVGVGEILPHRSLEAMSETTLETAVSSVQSIRDKLSPEFAAVSDTDLATAGVFAVVRRLPEVA